MRKLILLAAVSVLCGFIALQTKSVAQPVPAGDSTVKTIELPFMQPDLPDAPGKSTILSACVICHSPSYITQQPAFPRKTWEAEVDKMRKTFGAPVPDALVPEIVNYLMAIRGKPDAATQPAMPVPAIPVPAK